MTLSQTSRRTLTAGFLLTAVFHTGAAAQSNSPQGVRNVVIVHGAWADGSSWSKVIPLLQAKGLHVVAVQNPLTSLTDDVCRHQARHRIAGWTCTASGSFLRGSGYYGGWKRSKGGRVGLRGRARAVGG
jgi:pimeloyl-ACP methyl ester carboxylesterase